MMLGQKTLCPPRESLVVVQVVRLGAGRFAVQRRKQDAELLSPQALRIARFGHAAQAVREPQYQGNEGQHRRRGSTTARSRGCERRTDHNGRQLAAAPRGRQSKRRNRRAGRNTRTATETRIAAPTSRGDSRWPATRTCALVSCSPACASSRDKVRAPAETIVEPGHWRRRTGRWPSAVPPLRPAGATCRSRAGAIASAA